MACSFCATAGYVVGSVAWMKVEIKDRDGNYVDPGALVFKLLKPDGTLLSYTYNTNPQLERESLGIYIVEYKTEMAGLHSFRFESSGAGEGASEDFFEVARSSFS